MASFTPEQTVFLDSIKGFTEGNATLESTAAAISEPVNQDLTNDAKLRDLYTAVFQYAQTLPWDDARQEKLASLVAGLKAHATPVWNQLAPIGPFGTELLNTLLSSENAAASRKSGAVTNLNAFLARLFTAGTYDFSAAAYSSVKQALQERDLDAKQLWRADLLDGFLPAAAVHFIISSKGLYAKLQEKQAGEEAEKKWDGIAARFSAAAARDDLKPETQKLASLAAEEMKAAKAN